MRGINIHDVFIGVQRTKEIKTLQHNATLYATRTLCGFLYLADKARGTLKFALPQIDIRRAFSPLYFYFVTSNKKIHRIH